MLFGVAVKLGIDPVRCGITEMGITELTVAVWPWLLTMHGLLVLVPDVPRISLWLPSALGVRSAQALRFFSAPRASACSRR